VSTQPRDVRLFDLFGTALQVGLDYVRLADTGKTHIGTHTNWPELKWHDNGLPYLTSGISDGPKDYSEAIRGSLYSLIYGMSTGQKALDFRRETGFIALVEYAKTQPRLREYLMLERSSELFEDRILGILGDLLDRYIHVNKTTGLEKDKLLSIYLPIETGLYEESLPVTVVVPVLFLKFEATNFLINEHISIQKLPDDLQLSRAWRGPWGSSENLLVEGSATHALFIGNRSLQNTTWIGLGQNIISPQSYPTELIDTFFAAIRISTGHETGYAQLLSLPVGWASGYTADLTPIDGPVTDNCPPILAQGAWREDVPTVGPAELEQIKNTFQNLRQLLGAGPGKRIRIAVDRLNSSSMRTAEEDGIIDAMIAMEALLSSDGAQEMTHKVAMRVAALYKIAGDPRCQQVFKEMKHIYNFRSRIVHGASGLEKFRQLEREGTKVGAIDAAVGHLRIALTVLAENPVLLDPQRIDDYLLTGRF